MDVAGVWRLGMWPKNSPADAHDAFLPPRHICTIGFCRRLEPRRPCGRKITQLMLMMLSGRLVSNHWGGGFCRRLEPRRPCGRKIAQLMLMMHSGRLVKSAQSLGRWICRRLEPRPCGRKIAQLMLMMLSGRLVKSAQSLGRWILQASEA